MCRTLLCVHWGHSSEFNPVFVSMAPAIWGSRKETKHISNYVTASGSTQFCGEK